jgi:hypothetical protein
MKNNLKENLKQIRNKIKKSALKVNRNPEEIKLLAVSKTRPLTEIEKFYDLGINLFGESRAQELRDKNKEISNFKLFWHFIGHLQRNKVKYLLRMKKCKMIESLDSWRLAKEINKRAQKNKRIMPVLVEVNVSGEENKFGIKPKNTVEFVKKISNLSYINIEGLMTLAPYVKDSEETRPYFKMLAQLRDEINSQGYDLKELSMGMSDDFEVAIEEGATIVRIGTALFGNRNY